jgi:hypothetical protein
MAASHLKFTRQPDRCRAEIHFADLIVSALSVSYVHEAITSFAKGTSTVNTEIQRKK